MAIKIMQMKQANGTLFYPKTHINAVKGYVAGMPPEDVSQALEGKVDKVEGMGLSSNDYTIDEKNKVAQIEGKQDSVLTSPNGTKYKIFVNDDGTLRTEVVMP
ncbi:hypothetical protein [Niallia sp. 03091]|uniref:hypothetical protein n=1 Tax=Niallia sp. 03091 TaxID=3458059 RepID=UPI004043AE3D